MNRRPWTFAAAPLALGLAVALAGLAHEAGLVAGPARGKAPDAGRSYLVPYRLTDTNHFLVRVRINGKGPFNFLVDTGAPALYVGTEAAKKIGLEASRTQFYTKIRRLD